MTTQAARPPEKQSEWDLSVEELRELRSSGAPHVLIDVREPREYEICHLDGALVPLGTLAAHLDEFDRDARIVVHCRSGGRSAKAVELMRQAGFRDVWNLHGGILAWIDRVDPSLTRY